MRRLPTLFPSSVEIFIKMLIVYSVVTYFLELQYSGTSNSLEGWQGWIWSERIVAILFTVEYLWRWRKAATDDGWYGDKISGYPTSSLGIIDLLAILPFWLGFFVPVSWLGLIRTLRVLRLLKFYRYSRSMRVFIKAMLDCRRMLGGMAIIILILTLFMSVVIHQVEGPAQPDKFGDIGNCIYFTTVTLSTVGYGDMSPATPVGKVISQFLIISGVGIMAAFIGIVGSEVVDELKNEEAAYKKEKEEARG